MSFSFCVHSSVMQYVKIVLYPAYHSTGLSYDFVQGLSVTSANVPTPGQETESKNARYNRGVNIWSNSCLMLKDLSFLRQKRRVLAFFKTALVFCFQLSLSSKRTPRYLKVSTRSIAFPLMTTGADWPWFRRKSTTISFVLPTCSSR